MEHPGVHSEFIIRWLHAHPSLKYNCLHDVQYVVPRCMGECALKCGVIDLECEMETQRQLALPSSYRLLADQDGRPTKFAQTVERPTKTR